MLDVCRIVYVGMCEADSGVIAGGEGVVGGRVGDLVRVMIANVGRRGGIVIDTMHNGSVVNMDGGGGHGGKEERNERLSGTRSREEASLQLCRV